LRGDANSAAGLLQTRHLRAVVNFKTRAFPRSEEAMSQAVRIDLAAVFGKKRGGARERKACLNRWRVIELQLNSHFAAQSEFLSKFGYFASVAG
jgi:hypothetical protein